MTHILKNEILFFFQILFLLYPNVQCIDGVIYGIFAKANKGHKKNKLFKNKFFKEP